MEKAHQIKIYFTKEGHPLILSRPSRQFENLHSIVLECSQKPKVKNGVLYVYVYSRSEELEIECEFGYPLTSIAFWQYPYTE